MAYDVAVIFVHGVGAQRPGSALRDGVRALALTGAAIGTPAATQEDDLQSVCLESTEGKILRVACLDGWWDDIVTDGEDPPRPLRVWWWAFVIVPYLVTHSASTAIGAAWHRHGQPNPRFGSLRTFDRWILGAVQSAYWRLCVALPVLMIGLLLIFPWALVRSLMLRSGKGDAERSCVLHLLSAVLGDAWAYADSTARVEVLDRLGTLVEDARGMAPRVCVVAHSQGAALSRMLSERTAFDSLVTVGSGAQLLGAARRRRTGRVAYGWLLLITYGLFISLVTSALLTSLSRLTGALLELCAGLVDLARLSGEPDRQFDVMIGASNAAQQAVLGELTTDLSWMTIAAAIVMTAVLIVVKPDESSPDWGDPPKVSTWVDIASIYDPVSVGGPSMEDGAHRVEVVNSTRVRDVLLMREHTSYFDNRDVGETIARVLRGETANALPSPTTQRLTVLTASWVLLLPATAALIYLDWWPRGAINGTGWLLGAMMRGFNAVL